ncbi:hypothetical protein BV25DRAFT_1867320 [Artomyces pyxidatus]|uniref:Uncharacterized protein n=1 Tax=Artomyces pyxidatus TaxID=48021 RepID=A0ACB8TIQ9_9AGAM|nr:hypothetical protein BV25DRAFT_1867320 [Artomyces pyxidatus]
MEFIFDAKHQESVNKKLSSGNVVVSKLLIFPIKSCEGTSVVESTYTTDGLEFDRWWTIIDASNHKLFTARAIPKMVLIRPKVVQDPTDPDGGRLEISFPSDSDCETFSVPLRPTPSTLQQWTLVEDCSVHSMTNMDGYITQPHSSSGSEASLCSAVLSRFMGRPVHLIFKGPRPRPAAPTWSFEKLDPFVGYHDGYPLHVASEESMEGVKAMVKKWSQEHAEDSSDPQIWDTKSMVIERYRPNIVFKGAVVPFAEDMWREIVISPASGFKGNSPPSGALIRLLPNVDPASGLRNMSVPSKPLLKFRKGLDPGRPAFSCFGANAVPAGEGILRVGDVIAVKTWDNV